MGSGGLEGDEEDEGASTARARRFVGGVALPPASSCSKHRSTRDIVPGCMTKRKNGTVKQHPPPQQLASRSDLVRRPLTSILAFILLAALSAMQSDLLNPLFSATDSLPNSRALALGTLPAILLRGVMSNESTKAGWVAPFAIIGICLIFSELAVRWGGLWLMQQGFGRGRWIAIAALRGPPLLAASLWLARDPATSSVSIFAGCERAVLTSRVYRRTPSEERSRRCSTLFVYCSSSDSRCSRGGFHGSLPALV